MIEVIILGILKQEDNKGMTGQYTLCDREVYTVSQVSIHYVTGQYTLCDRSVYTVSQVSIHCVTGQYKLYDRSVYNV